MARTGGLKADPSAKTRRDDWETPNEIVQRIAHHLSINRFTVDVAATKATAKARRYITKEQDAFQVSWCLGKRPRYVWLNPPYGRGLAQWYERMAHFNARRAFDKGVLLVPANNTDASFFHLWALPYCTRILFFRRRICFLADGVVQTRPDISNMAIVFEPNSTLGRPTQCPKLLKIATLNVYPHARTNRKG